MGTERRRRGAGAVAAWLVLLAAACAAKRDDAVEADAGDAGEPLAACPGSGEGYTPPSGACTASAPCEFTDMSGYEACRRDPNLKHANASQRAWDCTCANGTWSCDLVRPGTLGMMLCPGHRIDEDASVSADAGADADAASDG